jgi:hypothetical protein
MTKGEVGAHSLQVRRVAPFQLYPDIVDIFCAADLKSERVRMNLGILKEVQVRGPEQ